MDKDNSEVIERGRIGRRLGIVSVVGILGALLMVSPALATTDATVTSVFSGLQTLFTGSLVPAVVIFFAAKIALVMATAWAGHIATSRKSA